LVWEPLLTGDLPGAATWSAPGRDRLPAIEPANRRDRPDGVERDLVVPCTAARVEDRVREREEELDRRVEIVLERACRVALQHLLCEEVPVPRRKLGMRPVRPVLGDHLLLVGERGADCDELLRLPGERGRPGPRRSAL